MCIYIYIYGEFTRYPFTPTRLCSSYIYIYKYIHACTYTYTYIYIYIYIYIYRQKLRGLSWLADEVVEDAGQLF